jgi:hypothetical protein
MRQLLRINCLGFSGAVAFPGPPSKDAMSPHPRTLADTDSNLATRANQFACKPCVQKTRLPYFYLAVNYQNKDDTLALSNYLDTLGQLVPTTNDQRPGILRGIQPIH